MGKRERTNHIVLHEHVDSTPSPICANLQASHVMLT